jgi:hypothetical protein
MVADAQGDGNQTVIPGPECPPGGIFVELEDRLWPPADGLTSISGFDPELPVTNVRFQAMKARSPISNKEHSYAIVWNREISKTRRL